MWKTAIALSVTLLVAPCGPLSRDSSALAQQQNAPSGVRPQITAKQAEALEKELLANPDNLSVREQLMTYYFEAMLTERAPELEEKREQHVLWIIEHHPEAEFAGSPEAGIQLPTQFSGSIDAYQRAKQLWLEQVEKHSNNQRILRNAGEFLLFTDKKAAQELFEKALAIDPGDASTASSLALIHRDEGQEAGSPEKQAAFAEKAFSVLQRVLENTDGLNRFYELEEVATAALEAGESALAEGYATELLQDAKNYKTDWNYGNAVHKGNIILGRLALRRGDIASAKQHLLLAGEMPGSPQLDSFGPNMTLAKELLEKGERETVVTYLQSCEKFWKMGGESLENWIATVKGGGTPDFSANLDY